MSDKGSSFRLSRRKMLAGLGAIGVASAGAGLGTTAYFNDQQSFEGNTITAGTLGIKVDWQQRYWGASPDVRPQDYATTMDGDAEVPNYPYVNAFPDDSGDGEQDLNGVVYAGENEVFSAADIPACCDCEDGEYYVTYEGESYCVEPLSGDVSVDDFYDYVETNNGNLYSSTNDDIQKNNTTVLFLYEDDSGNLSLVMVHDGRENGNGGSAASLQLEGVPTNSEWLIGPEDWIVKDDIEGPENQGFEQYDIYEVDWRWGVNRTDGGALGHLNDNFAVRLTTQFNEAAGRDTLGSGQIEEFVILSGGSGFDDSDVITLEDDIGATDNNDLNPITIHSECGLDMNEASESYGPNESGLIELEDVKPGDSGEVTFSLHVCDNPAYVWMGATGFSVDGNGDADSVLGDFVQARARIMPDCMNANDGFDDIAGFNGDVFFEGTLNEVFDLLNDPAFQGQPLTNADGDECFEPVIDSSCVAFEWWFPIGQDDVNDAQGETVSFDIGFYAEQCRHNDPPSA